MCILIICMFNISCDSTAQSQSINNNSTQIEQNSQPLFNQENYLYEKYSGTYMLYSIENNGEMHYVGEYVDGKIITLELIVVELYENKLGKIVIDGDVANITWTASTGKVNLINNSGENIITTTINKNILTLNFEGEGGSIIRLKKTVV